MTRSNKLGTGLTLAAALLLTQACQPRSGSMMSDASAGGSSMPGGGMMMAGGPSEVMVGGQPMLPSRDIVDNAVNSADRTTRVAAVQAADLVETLKGPGPFTVFAPTNNAFEDLPDGTVETLLGPDNKSALVNVLTYHVVPGELDAAALRERVMAGGGVAHVSTYDGAQSNGVIHLVDKVLLPR